MNEAAADPAADQPSRPTWTRYLKIGVPLVLVIAILLVIFWPRIQIKLAISGLNSHDPQTRRAQIETLKTYEDQDLVIEMLTSALEDDDSFEVRVQCGQLLYKHFNRLGGLEELLKTGGLTARCAILTVLAPEPFFMDEVAGNPALRVEETVLEWLKQDGDTTRVHAIQLAVRMQLAEALSLIRPLAHRSNNAATNMRRERDVMIAAASAMVSFKDCDHLVDLLDIAKLDPDPLVRLRFMQVLDRGAFAETPAPACPGSVSEDAMRAIVTGALDDEDKAVRMGALLILGRRPAWAEAALPRMREILGNRDLSGAERRHALEGLARLAEPEDMERFPQWFHDPAPEVRSSAVRAVAKLEGHHFEGCWIGIVEEETETQLIFHDALDYLYRFAKERVGFPDLLKVKAVQDPGALRQVEANLFGGQTVTLTDTKGGKVEISRHTVAEAWFRWWCKHREVAEADVDRAVAARKAYYEAKARDDVGAARAALDGLGFSEPQGLFAYERGWLATR